MRRLLAIFSALLLAVSLQAQIPTLKSIKNMDDELVPKEKKGKWGFANERGKFVIKAVFDEVDSLTVVTAPDGTSMQVARIRVGSSWGYITRENVYLVEPVYDTVSRFDTFSTIVATMGPFKTLMGLRGSISQRLEIPVVVSDILEVNLEEKEDFSAEGRSWAKKAGKWGVIGTDGKWILINKYHNLRHIVQATSQ